MLLRTRIFALLLAVLGLVGLGVAAAMPASAGGVGRVLADPCLNFRAGYDHNTGWDSQIGCIPINTTITIECINNGLLVYGPYGSETIWDRTTWNGITGYVSDAWIYTGSNSAVAPACGSTPPPPPTQPTPPPAIVGHANWVSGEQAVATRQGCANVMSVAVRGSNETDGPGKEVAAVANQLNTTLAQSISLRQVYIDYTSASVPSIVTSAQGPTYYFGSIDDGMTRLRTMLNYSAANCPNEKWVISGYSQGALVMHLLASEFANTNHLAAVVMIADPARRGNGGNGQNWGSAGNHNGIYTTLKQNVALPSLWANKILSVCDSRDVVCDLGTPYYAAVTAAYNAAVSIGGGIGLGVALVASEPVKNGINIHTSYLSRSTELTNVGNIAASWARRATGL